jgi:acylphosphatase
MPEPVARRAVISGRVQGVFFRDSTRRAAQSRGVAGWVRNRDDGAVEAHFEGDPEAVESMLRAVRDDPGKSDVDSVDVTEVEPEGFEGFDIR